MIRRAYHTVVHAVEAVNGLSKRDRFAIAIRRAIDGHRPHQHYVDAGIRRERSGAGEAALEASVRDWLATDLCAGVQLVRLLDSETATLVLYNEYNKAADLGAVVTIVQDESGSNSHKILRTVAPGQRDPAPCRDANLAAVEIQLGQVRRRSEQKSIPRKVIQVSELARYLALDHSAGFDAASFFEERPDANVSALAKALGCHTRTLSRQLREDGLSADAIRRACMLTKAVQELPGEKTLVEIAAECGYSDQAHMSRSIRDAFGLPPSVLRKIARIGAVRR
jgi:AraC-like DNA-binding protein